MPLVVLTGQPASGKSTVAAELRALLQRKGCTPIELVDEPSLHLQRNTAYASAGFIAMGGSCMRTAIWCSWHTHWLKARSQGTCTHVISCCCR